MSDFKNDLRRYIDGLERPVSVHETMSRQQERRRFRAPAAVLAGAAIVMIPALVLIGVRFLPGDDGDVAQTTAPAISETTTTASESPTTTAAAAPTAFVTVPDIVGLPLDRAQEVLSSLGLELEVIEMRPSSDFTGISAQDPAGSTSVAVGSTVIVDVYVPPTCVVGEPEIADGSMGVTVLFQCGTSSYPNVTFPITRSVPEDTDEIAATLRALLAGPTESEKASGYGSFFSEESAEALNSLSLADGLLTVDFNEAILVNNASTSTGSLFFMAELQANLFQFADVESIEFQLNGSCDAFFGWLQGECTTVNRTDWEAALAAWEAEGIADVDIDQPIGQIDLHMADRLTAFAQGTALFSELSFADEVILGLNTVEQITVAGTDLEVASTWIIPFEDFGGIAGPFDILGPLRTGASVLEVNLGPRTHCAGPPLNFEPEWDEGRHLVIEPTGTDSCLQWFAVHVLLNPNNEIQAVTLDLWEP